MQSSSVRILRRDLWTEKIADHGVLFSQQRYQTPYIVFLVILNGFYISSIGSDQFILQISILIPPIGQQTFIGGSFAVYQNDIMSSGLGCKSIVLLVGLVIARIRNEDLVKSSKDE